MTPLKAPLPAAARGGVSPAVRYASQQSVDSLSEKVDKMAKTLEKVLITLEALKSSSPPPSTHTLAAFSPPIDMARTVYESCARVLSDKVEYEEKERRVVVIGSAEDPDPVKTLAKDELLIEQLVDYCEDPDVKQAWKDGQIKYHRHPKERKAGARPLKVELPNKKLRDLLLDKIRAKPGRPTPLPAPSFIRKDLTPMQLQLEREAREEVKQRNLNAGSLSFGLRDFSIISYRNPRPLPKHYGTTRTATRTAPPSSLSADIPHSGDGSDAALLSDDASTAPSTSGPTPPVTRSSHVNTDRRGAARH
ncbi:hypothetical protein PRIPAC_90648 [Pristionchus pacificus]|uniref:Uncharacterized protein n=2 Tax=Pristionchus pacificus TaxID=54126 RepID=A0A2A6CX08_PRIPA|nr:hypothetical protein PRIPAC_90648 [Pristionchus pacificus]|eukprot:PDM82616.1 hypothetical protein PRIPAC_37009 [Pristionchus pacificus]